MRFLRCLRESFFLTKKPSPNNFVHENFLCEFPFFMYYFQQQTNFPVNSLQQSYSSAFSTIAGRPRATRPCFCLNVKYKHSIKSNPFQKLLSNMEIFFLIFNKLAPSFFEFCLQVPRIFSNAFALTIGSRNLYS